MCYVHRIKKVTWLFHRYLCLTKQFRLNSITFYVLCVYIYISMFPLISPDQNLMLDGNGPCLYVWLICIEFENLSCGSIENLYVCYLHPLNYCRKHWFCSKIHEKKYRINQLKSLSKHFRTTLQSSHNALLKLLMQKWRQYDNYSHFISHSVQESESLAHGVSCDSVKEWTG